MNPIHHWHLVDPPDQKTPDGDVTLRKLLETELGITQLSLEAIHSGGIGEKCPALLTAIGAAFSLGSQYCTCEWGCKGGDHLVQGIVGRAIGFGLAANRLMFSGYYEEALGLCRGMGEVLNLLQLFHVNASSMNKWKSSSDADRRNHFRPAQVRKAITATGATPVMDANTYSRLCEIGIHISPISLSMSFSHYGRTWFGAGFSETALSLVLTTLGSLLSSAMAFIRLLDNIDEPHANRLQEVQTQLSSNCGDVTATNFDQVLRDVWGDQYNRDMEKYLASLSHSDQEHYEHLAGAELERIVEEDERFRDIGLDDLVEMLIAEHPDMVEAKKLATWNTLGREKWFQITNDHIRKFNESIRPAFMRFLNSRVSDVIDDM